MIRIKLHPSTSLHSAHALPKGRSGGALGGMLWAEPTLRIERVFHALLKRFARAQAEA